MILLGCLGVIFLGFAAVVASSIIAGSRGQSQDDALLAGLGVFGWSLIVVGLCVCCLLLFDVLGILVAIAGVIVAAEICVKHQAARQRALFGALAAAAERSLPLVPVVAAFARERRDRFARRADRLAGMLNDGVSLPDAIRQVRGLAPVGALPMILIGYQSGSLAGALRHVAEGPGSRNRLWMSLAGKLLYLCGLLGVAACVVTYMMMAIVPEFELIFDDFEIELPAMTSLVIDASRFFANAWFLFFPIFVAVFSLAVYAILRFIGLIHWELPGFDRLVRRLDTAAIFDAMALASGCRRPPHESVAILAGSYHKASIRRRLTEVSRDLQSGADWLDSLLRRGLLKQADLAVLRAAQRVGNLPWALREMADSSRRRLAYRLYAMLQVASPLVILVLGGLVMLFVVSMFLPLIVLIQGVGS